MLPLFSILSAKATDCETQGTNCAYTFLEPIPGLGDAGKSIVVSSSTLSTYFNNVYTYVIVIICVIAVFFLMYYGILFLTTDIISKKMEGREGVVKVITGIVFIFSAWVILNSINPNILRNTLFGDGYISDVGGGNNNGAPNPTTPTEPLSDDIKVLASQILNSGKVNFAVLNPGDMQDRSDPRTQMQDMANGQQPRTSTRCSTNPNAGQAVNPDIRIMKFIAALARDPRIPSVQITSLFGQCHSANSKHYSGQAVDFGCPAAFSQKINIVDEIAQSQGVNTHYTGEWCNGYGTPPNGGGNHWHYQVN